MFCGNCGATNTDNQAFCYSCGAALNSSPQKKSKKPLIISLIVLVLLAITAAVIFFIVLKKPSTSDSKITSPEDLVQKYMKALQKGNMNKMEECFLPEMYEFQKPRISELNEKLADYFKKQNGKIDYDIKKYKAYTGSSFEKFQESVLECTDIKKNKIDEIGILYIEFTLENTDYDSSFYLIKYDKEWYLLLDPFSNIISNQPEDAKYPLVDESTNAKDSKANSAKVDNSKNDKSKDSSSKDNSSSSTGNNTNSSPEDLVIRKWYEAAIRGDDSAPKSLCHPDLYNYNNEIFLNDSYVLYPYYKEGYSFDIDVNIYDDVNMNNVEEYISTIEESYDFDSSSIEEVKMAITMMSLNNLESSKTNSYDFQYATFVTYLVKIDGNWYILTEYTM